MISFIQEKSYGSRCKLQADMGKPVPIRETIKQFSNYKYEFYKSHNTQTLPLKASVFTVSSVLVLFH